MWQAAGPGLEGPPVPSGSRNGHSWGFWLPSTEGRREGPSPAPQLLPTLYSFSLRPGQSQGQCESWTLQPQPLLEGPGSSRAQRCGSWGRVGGSLQGGSRGGLALFMQQALPGPLSGLQAACPPVGAGSLRRPLCAPGLCLPLSSRVPRARNPPVLTPWYPGGWRVLSPGDRKAVEGVAQGPVSWRSRTGGHSCGTTAQSWRGVCWGEPWALGAGAPGQGAMSSFSH